MFFQDKTAVIFGAGGAVGSQVVRVLARGRDHALPSERCLGSAESVVTDIRVTQGKAEATEMDPLNGKAINDFLKRVARQAGAIVSAPNETAAQHPDALQPGALDRVPLIGVT